MSFFARRTLTIVAFVVTTAVQALANPPAKAEQKTETGHGDAGISAGISFPYDNSLLRANVPIFGIADAKEFASYRLEFGEGENPEEWILIKESRQPQPNDPWAEGRVKWNKNWGAEDGNLGLWRTGLTEYGYGQAQKHDLLGSYTLRLTVCGSR